MISIVNIHDEPCTHYCGRKTSYNRFEDRFGEDLSILGNVCGGKRSGVSRSESLALYDDYLFDMVFSGNEEYTKAFETLHEASKKAPVKLGCFCKPRRCHCDSIVKVFYMLYPEGHNELFS